MPSIREVAQRAGVSLGTVSNVLNRPEMVSEATRLRVQAVIEQLGFVRNGSAHQLRARRSYHLGLIVLDVTNPFFTEVARGVEDAANAAGYVVILCNSDSSADKESRYLHMIEEQRTAGVVITPVQNDLAYLQHLRQRNIAVVLLDRPSQARDLCSVAIDDVLGGELATRHLLELGHRRIAFVSGPLSIRQYAERRRGARQAVEMAGLNPDDIVHDSLIATQQAHSSDQCVEALLASTPRPSAIFCASDLLALGVMRGLGQRGIKIPADMALVGYDDVEFASMLSPALTSIRQPKYQLGQAAAELLLAEIHATEKHLHTQIMYQPELIVRASTQLASAWLPPRAL
ncbi:MAG TPA: substrate-binding domain-containing protein [Ktedonobacteraceae bacterium]